MVDGNVFRVLSRYFNIDSDISEGKTKKEFQNIAQEVLPTDKPALFNQAIMEFGAMQCVPKNPNCNSCILNSSCAALQHKKVLELPVKTKKTKVTNRYLNYLILKDIDSNYIVQKREGKGIWENLYEFPMIETEDLVSEHDFMNQLAFVDFFNKKPNEIFILNQKIILHKLSHQNLHIRFFQLNFNEKLPDSKTFAEIEKLPFPIVIHNFMNSNCFNSL